jgi:hypothetical protein
MIITTSPSHFRLRFHFIFASKDGVKNHLYELSILNQSNLSMKPLVEMIILVTK